MNAVSHPLLWYICFDRPALIVPMEFVVMGLEGFLGWLVLRRMKAAGPAKTAFTASVAANGFSWLVGPTVLRLLGVY